MLMINWYIIKMEDPDWQEDTKDDWETPMHVWMELAQYLPDVLLWDPFYCDGRASVYWEDLGWEIYHELEDIFDVQEPNGQIVVTNPPFSKLENVLPKLHSFNLPTVLLIPKEVTTRKWFVDLYQFDETTSKEAPDLIHFIQDGKMAEGSGPACVFYFVNCFWLDREIKKT